MIRRRLPRRKSTVPPIPSTSSRALPHPTTSPRKPFVPVPKSFDYAIVRVVPRVEREEFINAGVILFCRTAKFLGARVYLDKQRLTALAPLCEPEEVERHLDLIPLIAHGD